MQSFKTPKGTELPDWGDFFYSSVKVRGECYEWDKAIDSRGYGHLKFQGKIARAHRVSWLLWYRKPAEQWVLHHCDNRKCVRPEHLFSGSRQDNVRDCVKKNRHFISAGIKNGRAKLTDAQVKIIRESKTPRATLAKLYGVSLAAIRRIQTREAWKHLK